MMARARKFVLVPCGPKSEERTSSNIKRLCASKLFVLAIFFYNVTSVMVLYNIFKSNVIQIEYIITLFLISIYCQLSIVLMPVYIQRKMYFDLTKINLVIPFFALVTTCCLIFCIDFWFFLELLAFDQHSWLALFVVVSLQFLVLYPFAVCVVSFLKYGSKFRFITGIVLKLLKSQWQSKEKWTKRYIEILRWFYRNLGSLPSLQGRLAVSIEICSEKDSDERHISKFDFPNIMHTSMEDVAEGCFVAKRYLIQTGQLDEQAKRPWSSGAVEFLNSMIDNPKFYSELPVSYQTKKRTGRRLAEYGQKLFRTEDDEYFEGYRGPPN